MAATDLSGAQTDHAAATLTARPEIRLHGHEHGYAIGVDKHEFMRACREGGARIEQVLRTLDRSFHSRLYASSLRSLRDTEAARDAVQETFIKVWSRCATFQGQSELLPWIEAILRHTIFDRLRRPDREVPMPEDDSMSAEMLAGLFEAPIGTVRSPPDEAERAELAECFERCWVRFETACPAHASVIRWIVADGLEVSAISELLDRSPGATREFISQCRKRARIHLAEWYELALAQRATR